jgi:endoglucanase
MKRLILYGVVLISILSFDGGYLHPRKAVIQSIALIPKQDPAGDSLHRGVNLANMLEAPNEGDWGLSVHEEYFDLIEQAGFDFVRLPIRWNAHAKVDNPYTIDPVFFARIDQVITWAQKDQLTIILDFHNYGEIMTDPQNNRERFLFIWRQIAEHYRDYPPQVMFELLNEPNDWLNASVWNDYLGQALGIVRMSNPKRDVIIDSPESGYYEWLNTLNAPEDPHILVTFHYYEPFHFTHQGADWVGMDTQSWLGTTWLGTDAEKAQVIANFDSVAAWAKQKNIRILLGEFGAYSTAEMASRVRWTEYVAREAERHGFAWAYWEFGAGFGVYDPDTNSWREDLLRALIP